MTSPATTVPADRLATIPLWINGLSIVIALILAFQCFSGYFEPSLAFGDFSLDRVANREAMSKLAGRNLVMLVLTLLALMSRNPLYLAGTFLMHFLREAQDLFIVPYHLGFTTPKGMAVFCVLLFMFVIPEFVALKTLRKIARG